MKSDHLGCADLEDLIEAGTQLKFVIEKTKQEIGATVAGKKGNFNIAYFREKIKPLVLNSTNCKVIKGITGSPFVEDWNNVSVELYIDSTVKMKGEIVGGVRLKSCVNNLPILNNSMESVWKNACRYFFENNNYDSIEQRYVLTDSVKKEIETEVKSWT